MTKEEKLVELAEMLEVEVDELADDAKLVDFETWDSVAVLGVISFMNENFDKYPHAEEIAKLETVADLLEFMS